MAQRPVLARPTGPGGIVKRSLTMASSLAQKPSLKPPALKLPPSRTATRRDDFGTGSVISSEAPRSREIWPRILRNPLLQPDPSAGTVESRPEILGRERRLRQVRDQISPLRSAARTSGRNDNGRAVHFRSGQQNSLQHLRDSQGDCARQVTSTRRRSGRDGRPTTGSRRRTCRLLPRVCGPPRGLRPCVGPTGRER
jgi:hypothetical protein